MQHDTIFVRHKLNTTRDILTALWDENLIAIHYVDDESTDPEHYLTLGCRTAARVLRRLHSCLVTGATVAASYREIKPGMLKVGRIDPARSRIVARCFKDAAGSTLIYKVVNMVGVRDIHLAQYPVLGGIQPPGPTLTGWPCAATILDSILEDKPLPLDVGSLHFSQLETLCHEYLRDTGQLRSLLAPIGRNMYEVDICGIARDGALLLAQVTFSADDPTIHDKANRLAAFAGHDRRLIFFGPASVHVPSNVVSVSIEDVFAHMMATNPALVRKMLNMDLVVGRDALDGRHDQVGG